MMTQKERAQVWTRKDQLSKALTQLAADDKRSQAHVKGQIETCNQASVQEKFELLPQDEETVA